MTSPRRKRRARIAATQRSSVASSTPAKRRQARSASRPTERVAVELMSTAAIGRRAPPSGPRDRTHRDRRRRRSGCAGRATARSRSRRRAAARRAAGPRGRAARRRRGRWLERDRRDVVVAAVDREPAPELVHRHVRAALDEAAQLRGRALAPARSAAVHPHARAGRPAPGRVGRGSRCRPWLLASPTPLPGPACACAVRIGDGRWRAVGPTPRRWSGGLRRRRRSRGRPPARDGARGPARASGVPAPCAWVRVRRAGRRTSADATGAGRVLAAARSW